MGLFGKRQPTPLAVGSALCVVDRDGRGWVGQRCHTDMLPDTVALLAATTFMIQGARTRALRRLPVEPWLEATRTAATYPEAFNEMMNSSGIAPIGHGAVPPGVGMSASFSILASGSLTGEWDPLTTFDNIALASRLFGVLAAAALWCDADDAVELVARRLDETCGEIDFTRPHLMAQMPQAMVAYASHQTADGMAPRARREGHPGEPPRTQGT